MSRSRLAASEGFTLVELLVVILIVAILGAIGLGAFLHQRSKAEDSEAKVYATTAAKAMIVWGGEHGGYGAATQAGLARIEPSLARARGLTIAGDAHSFRVSVDSTSSDGGGGPYTIERSDSGAARRTCGTAGQGGCADAPDANGNWW